MSANSLDTGTHLRSGHCESQPSLPLGCGFRIVIFCDSHHSSFLSMYIDARQPAQCHEWFVRPWRHHGLHLPPSCVLVLRLPEGVCQARQVHKASARQARLGYSISKVIRSVELLVLQCLPLRPRAALIQGLLPRTEGLGCCSAAVAPLGRRSVL